MRVSDLIRGAQDISLDRKRSLHEEWIRQSFQLAELAGTAHLHSLQTNARLDLLIRQLEEEWEAPSTAEIDLLLDFRFSLSECWVLRSYEAVRAAIQQLRSKGMEHERLTALKHRLGLVRIPIAKAEIQRASRAVEPISFVYSDGSPAGEYTSDGTYIMPRGICTLTGSATWFPVDVTTGQSEQIRRIDLSNELLHTFL